jgi:hypothetical protein
MKESMAGRINRLIMKVAMGPYGFSTFPRHHNSPMSSPTFRLRGRVSVMYGLLGRIVTPKKAAPW